MKPPAPIHISIVSSGVLSEVSNANEVERSDSLSLPSWIPLPVQGEGKRARRARVRAVATSTSRSAPCVKSGYVPKLLSRCCRPDQRLPSSCNSPPPFMGEDTGGGGSSFHACRTSSINAKRFSYPRKSPMSVILRVPRGESRRAEDRELGSLRANRAQNDKSWVVGSDRKIVRLFLLVSSSDER
jgi:hypothetical protein